MKKPENIIFIGIMASGKTTVGKRIAQKLDYDFIDTDCEIERITGRTINDIFKKEGELRFRSEETLALKRLKDRKSTVISTGGGIILKEENRRLLKEMGIIVYLDAKSEIIAERAARNKNRPLLKDGDILEKIRQLKEERNHLYEGIADIKIKTDRASLDFVVRDIEKIIMNYKKDREGREQNEKDL